VVALPDTIYVLASHLYRAEPPLGINVATFVPGKKKIQYKCNPIDVGDFENFLPASLLPRATLIFILLSSCPGLSFLLSFSSSDPLLSSPHSLISFLCFP
jgi:hypothetical protein